VITLLGEWPRVRLVAQIDGDYDLAILHREIEAQMIVRLHKLEEENPTEGWTLQNFQSSDIEKRTTILKHLRNTRSFKAVIPTPATQCEVDVELMSGHTFCSQTSRPSRG
jgi:hypothetical protein